MVQTQTARLIEPGGLLCGAFQLAPRGLINWRPSLDSNQDASGAPPSRSPFRAPGRGRQRTQAQANGNR
jgi:hypothetical protein